MDNVLEKATNLSREQKASLLLLCRQYQHIFNVGNEPLTTTTLTAFKMEPPQVSEPILRPPRF